MTAMRGRASSVRDRGDGTVLRVGGRPELEAAIMEVARANRFPVPRVHEVLPDALVLQRIEGPLMSAQLGRRPWLLRRHMRTLVELHDRLHAIALEGRSIVHFDLHPENVVMSADGPVVIDWTNAHAGDPEADLALTWLILETSAGMPGRVAARAFRSAAGRDRVARGVDAAAAYRLADPHVTDDERAAVRRVLG